MTTASDKYISWYLVYGAAVENVESWFSGSMEVESHKGIHSNAEVVIHKHFSDWHSDPWGFEMKHNNCMQNKYDNDLNWRGDD